MVPAVAVQGVKTGWLDVPAFGEEKRGEDESRSCEGRDWRVWISIPEIEIRDSWDAALRSVGRCTVVGDIRSSSSMWRSGEARE